MQSQPLNVRGGDVKSQINVDVAQMTYYKRVLVQEIIRVNKQLPIAYIAFREIHIRRILN